jgi:hypothetical protein
LKELKRYSTLGKFSDNQTCPDVAHGTPVSLRPIAASTPNEGRKFPWENRKIGRSGARACQNFANSGRQFFAFDGNLRRRALGPFGTAFDLAGKFRAERHVL